jgi:hypothetical protein
MLLPGVCLGQSDVAVGLANQNITNNSVPNNTSVLSGDAIVQQINLYRNARRPGTVYVHFDKTTYTNNEEVWFTAYLLNCASPEKHTTLSVALINADDRKIALQQLFLMAEGRSYGHITLPDTIAPGNYHFLAYTNILSKNGKPADIYDQPVTIKTTRTSAFDASVKLLDTVRDSHGNLTAIVRVDSKNINVKPLADIEYGLGQKMSKGKTNAFGEYAISIPPVSGNLLKVSIKKGSDLQFLSLRLPVNKSLPSVKFYPEGGNMIENTNNFIGWEARSSTGEYLRLRGILYKNNLPADTIETNYYGIGKFKLSPQKNCSYSFRIIKAGNFADVKDTTYSLPPALSVGPTIHIANVLAEDTLSVELKSTSRQKVTLVLHNFNNIIACKEMEANPTGYQIKFVLTGAPKGLATLTVLDSIGRPLAERLFFAHYRQENSIDIEVDKTEYGTREKVNLKLKLNNTKGGQTNGVVSIACVQDNRVENDKQTDITTYLYLKHDLQQLPADPLSKNYGNPDYIRDLLLVKGWRRYKWADVINTIPVDTIKSDSLAHFMGNVSVSNKPIKKSVTLILAGRGDLPTIETNSKGGFTVPTEDLLQMPGKKLTLMVAGKNPNIYTIDVTNPYQKINADLAGTLITEQGKLSQETNSRLQAISGFERAIALKEVVIKGRNDNGFYGAKGWDYHNKCPDYVCINNVLNCQNHTDPYRKPEIGKTYTFIRNNVTTVVTYSGCTVYIEKEKENFVPLTGINLPKEYYPIDSTQIAAPEPEYLSTIYWNYGVKADSNNKVNLSFYTGDITGNFRVIAQGAGENEVWSKQLTFTVKKKMTP